LSTPAERQRRRRANRAAGLREYRVMLVEADLEDALVRAGWLRADQADDVREVEAALVRMLTCACALDV
jgi:hypothetical protein